MKKLSLIVFLFLISISIFCQIPASTISIEDKKFNDFYLNSTNIPLVRGRILNASKKDLEKISINYTIVTPLEQGQINKNCSLNPDGTFEFELDYAFPYQQIWISAEGLFYAGIHVNTDLYIEADAEILKSKKGVKYNGTGIKYLGTDGELNNYINNHVLFKRKIQLELNSKLQKLNWDRKIDYDAYISKYDSLYIILRELDNEFIQQNPSEFSWIIVNERQSDYYADLCVKHWRKEMSGDLFEEVKKHKAYLTSNSGMGFYNYLFTYLTIIANKGEKKDYGSYKSYSGLQQDDELILDTILLIENDILKNIPYDTSKYVALKRQANQILHDTMLVETTSRTISLLDSIFEQPKADFLKIKITSTSSDLHDKKLQMGTVLRHNKTEWSKIIIDDQYAETSTKIESINETLDKSQSLTSSYQLGDAIAEFSFGAKLFKVDTLESKQFLANIKSSFEGKAILIDFWATWCGACLEEMPHSKKLYNEVKELPIEFVYLCTSQGSNIDQWKSKIAEFEIGGIHIFVERDIESELMDLFSFSGYPSYVLIDKKGVYNPGAIKRIAYLDKEKLTKLIK